MTRWLLIVAAIVDGALAILLIAISGFIVGSGPESMQAGRWGAAALASAVIACLAAPVAGFAMRAWRRPAGGILIAWLPAVAALTALALPPGY